MGVSDEMKPADIVAALNRVGQLLAWPTPVEILLVGGAAGMFTGLLTPDRVTRDCDVASLVPAEAAHAVEAAGRRVAAEKNLPDDWLNDRAGELNALPDGWKTRRVHIADFGNLRIFAASRIDLLATKIFAHRDVDRRDIAEMDVQPDDIQFVRTYLNMLRVPGRKADLDQVQQALKYLDILEGNQR